MIILSKVVDDTATAVAIENGSLKVGDYLLSLVASDQYVAFFKTQSGDVVKVDGSWLVMQRDAPAILRTSYHVADMRADALATVWQQEGQVVAIIAKPCSGDLVKGASAARHNLEILGDYFPDAKALYRKWKARQDFLFDINPIDSLAALERQVDVLTELLLTLVPENKQATLKQYLKLASNSPENVQKSLEFKKHIRELQAQYESHK